MELILILIIILVIFIIIKNYKKKYDTIVAFTGGLGSGKSLLSVQTSIKLLRKNRNYVWRQNNIWRYLKKIKSPKKPLQPILEKPMLYSSIPIYFRCHFWNKKEWSIKLEEEHLLLIKKLGFKAVVFIDEIGSFANQFQYKNSNILDNFNEFIRLFRHYTKGGYLVVNDQCSENIVLEVRRRINQVYNLMSFRHIWFIYWVKVRNISISEEIKTIEENNKENNMSTMFGIMPSKKTYDTYCYSERYSSVPTKKEKNYNKLKKNDLLVVSNFKKEKKTTSAETPPPLQDKPLEGQKAKN